MLKCFTKNVKKLSNCMMIIRQLSKFRLSLKQLMQKDPKILTPEQMLQRLPIALVQVKSDNASENFLNEIRQIIYSLHQGK